MPPSCVVDRTAYWQIVLPGTAIPAIIHGVDRTCHGAGDVINVEHNKGMPKTPKGISHAQILR